MTNPSKAFRRLGMVGAAAVVGLVPVALAGGTAFANVSNAGLAVSPTTTGATSQVTNTFTTNTALPAGGTITIVSNDNSGCVIALPASAALSTAGTPTNYGVSFTPSGGSATAETGTATDNGTFAACAGGSPAYTGDFTGVQIAVNTPIPAGSAVTVTINNAQNPPTPSGAFFSDSTSAETQAINTPVVNIGNASVSNPGVSSVNPTAYTAAGGEPFTVTGTNFSNTYNTPPANPSPVVCFVESTTTAPPVNSAAPATNPCAAPVVGTGTLAGVTVSAPATNTAFSAGEIQGTSPALTAGHNYNVVVYNYNGGASTPTYTPPSGVTSQTLVGVSAGLNVVPESGVRVVDSRSGLNLPKGNMTPNTPTAIPLAAFAQSLTLPTNLPAVGGYTGLALNVTAVAPATGGNIQVWAAPAGACPNGLTGGAIKPVTVNFQPPQDTNNSQIVPIPGGDNQLCVQNNGAAVSLVVDVVGYTVASAGAPPDTNYNTANARLLDTRSGSGGLLGPLQPNTVYQFNAGAGLANTTVALNVAAVAPGGGGNLRVFPEANNGACGSNPTPVSQVPNAVVDNYIPNTDSSSELITTVGCNGFLDIYSAGSAVNVVIDELGTFGAGSSLHTVTQPFRIYDSRPGPINAAGTVNVTAAPSGSGANFVPSGSLGIVGNLSDINPTGQGFEVTFPAGGTVPGTATIAHFPAQTRNTNAVTALNPGNGMFSIFNSGASTNSTFDVTAYIK